MVRALLDGSKTQTRRVVKDLPPWEITEICHDAGGTGMWMPNGPSPSGSGMAAGHWRHCPYGQPGDRLWVRETFLGWYNTADGSFSHVAAFKADGYQLEYSERWRPSIHMPRAASRILLEIVSVRVDRLQGISDSDARAEGATGGHGVVPSYNYNATPSEHFSHIWESINGAGNWDANPWCWVVEFKRVLP
jgi:hypothetical protein